MVKSNYWVPSNYHNEINKCTPSSQEDMSVLYDFLEVYTQEDEDDFSLLEDPKSAPLTALPVDLQSNPSSTFSSSLLSTSTKATSILEESFKHNFLCSQNNKALSLLSNVSNPNSKDATSLDELNGINLELLTKREKKQLKNKFQKDYHVNFYKADFSTTSSHFGSTWDKAHRELVQSDWERIKFLANPPTKQQQQQPSSSWAH